MSYNNYCQYISWPASQCLQSYSFPTTTHSTYKPTMYAAQTQNVSASASTANASTVSKCNMNSCNTSSCSRQSSTKK